MSVNKKILITGVTGQDGSNMVRFLLKNTDLIITINYFKIPHFLGSPNFLYNQN